MLKGQDYTGVSVVYFCHDGQGNVVLAKRSTKARDEQGRWDIGGGGLEFNDTVEDTLRKEIREEYDADVLNYKFLGFRDVHRIHNDKPTHWIALDFKVLVDRLQVKNHEPEKFEEVKWFPITALPQPLHSQLPTFFDKYRTRL